VEADTVHTQQFQRVDACHLATASFFVLTQTLNSVLNVANISMKIESLEAVIEMI
jgi:hypothetical protein